MFGDVDKKLMKYFKRKQESPLDILIKLIKKDEGKETQETVDKKRKDKKNDDQPKKYFINPSAIKKIPTAKIIQDRKRASVFKFFINT